MYDEYGSEAYFCGSSCSECDSHNHQESDFNENQPDFERDPTEEQKQEGLEPAVSLENQKPSSEKPLSKNQSLQSSHLLKSDLTFGKSQKSNPINSEEEKKNQEEDLCA